MLPPKDHSRFLEYWTCSSANTLPNYSRGQSRIVLSSFHSMIIEMVNRGILAHDIAASVSIRGSSRYDTPVIIPTIEDVQNLLLAADKLADSKNAQIARSWERYRPMLYLAADSGMLPQQYVVVPRFNVLGNGVKVDRALEMGGYKISVTKTPADRRLIDLSPDTVDMITYNADNLATKSTDKQCRSSGQPIPSATAPCVA